MAFIFAIYLCYYFYAQRCHWNLWIFKWYYLFSAKSMLKKLKSEMDPCEDNHAFACGKYIEKYGSERGNSFQDAEYAMFENINSKNVLILFKLL